MKKKSNPLQTIFIIIVGFLVIYLLTRIEWFLIASIITGVLSVSSKFIAAQIDYIWMKLAWVLGLFMPKIILTIVYFLFLLPIALLSRLFGEKNQLSLKNIDDSLFKTRASKFEKRSFENPW